MQKRIQKTFFVSQIIASQNVAKNCLYSEVNTSYRQLTNSPKILHISKRDFFNLNCVHRDQ